MTRWSTHRSLFDELGETEELDPERERLLEGHAVEARATEARLEVGRTEAPPSGGKCCALDGLEALPLRGRQRQLEIEEVAPAHPRRVAETSATRHGATSVDARAVIEASAERDKRLVALDAQIALVRTAPSVLELNASAFVGPPPKTSSGRGGASQTPTRRLLVFTAGMSPLTRQNDRMARTVSAGAFTNRSATRSPSHLRTSAST